MNDFDESKVFEWLNIAAKNEVLTVSAWLDIATRKLSEPAKERITAEIESHYADAVETHLANGSSQTFAHFSAVAELGDPKVAAKRFRKCHLTEREARTVNRTIKASPNVYALLVNCGIFVLCVFQLFPLFQVPPIINGATFFWMVFDSLFLLAIPTGCFLVARSRYSKINLRSLIFFQSLCAYPTGTPLIYYFLFRVPGPAFSHWLYCLAGAFLLIDRLQLWNKLRKVAEIQAELS